MGKLPKIFFADSFDYSIVENFKGFLQSGGNTGRKRELARLANPLELMLVPKAATAGFSILNASQATDSFSHLLKWTVFYDINIKPRFDHPSPKILFHWLGTFLLMFDGTGCLWLC